MQKPQPPRPVSSKPTARTTARTSARATDWNEVAQWYDQVVGADGSEYHQHVIFPKTLKLLQLQPESRVIDLASGQGVFCRLVGAQVGRVVGVEASDELIRLAKNHPTNNPIRYLRADAREFVVPFRRVEPDLLFDRAACILAIQNISPIAGVFASLAQVMNPGGLFVMVMMHPCFRGAKESHWGFDKDQDTQYRRVDRYLLPRKHPIVAHPGKKDLNYTWTFHRPIEAYVRDLAKAGFVIDALEEWASHSQSQPGARATAENRSRQEIPMFMAIRARKL